MFSSNCDRFIKLISLDLRLYRWLCVPNHNNREHEADRPSLKITCTHDIKLCLQHNKSSFPMIYYWQYYCHVWYCFHQCLWRNGLLYLHFLKPRLFLVKSEDSVHVPNPILILRKYSSFSVIDYFVKCLWSACLLTFSRKQASELWI